MKEYPSIPKALDKFIGRECISFRKYDGSNIRISWTPKRGWYKFGTRTRLFSESEPTFGCIIELFKSQYAEGLEKAICDNFTKVEEVTVFLEFLGPNSFAGMHEPSDTKELVLFDVNVLKRGIVSPKNFVKIFGHLRSAEPLYEGKLTEKFIQKVRNSELPVDEGVVCKGKEGHNFWCCKIKTWAYLKKIQKFFGSSYGKYWE